MIDWYDNQAFDRSFLMQTACNNEKKLSENQQETGDVYINPW